MRTRAWRCMSLHLSLVLVLFIFNCSHPSSLLFLFPSIPFHIFPSAFSTHQRDSPEVEDNPTSEQWVFHVLGRHTGESTASTLSTLKIPAASKPCRLPALCLSYSVFSQRNMFSFITKPGRQRKQHKLQGVRSIFRCWSLREQLADTLVFCVIWTLLKGTGEGVWEEHCRTPKLDGYTVVK